MINKEIRIRLYTNEDYNLWQSFLKSNKSYSFQFSRTFLDVSKKGVDSSLIIENQSKPVGLFPNIYINSNRTETISHAGSSYGGILTKSGTSTSTLLSYYQAIASYAKEATSIKTMGFRIPPDCVRRNIEHDIHWVMWKLGARVESCYLHTTVNLNNKIEMDNSRINLAKIPSELQIAICGSDDLVNLWNFVSDVLENRHGIKPVHTLDEITFLANSFPKNILMFFAKMDKEIVAAAIFFNTVDSFRLQYMAVSELGRSISAGDYLILQSIKLAKELGFSYFDFGHSQESGGRFLNDSLMSFKMKFGGSNYAAFTYSLWL
jgi:hypothetical protein